jgi:hypothetical protein
MHVLRLAAASRWHCRLLPCCGQAGQQANCRHLGNQNPSARIPHPVID